MRQKTGCPTGNIANVKFKKERQYCFLVFLYMQSCKQRIKNLTLLPGHMNREFLFKTFPNEEKIKPSERRRAFGLGSDNPELDF